MITFATVLRSGGRYDARWVEALFRAVRRHGPAFKRFVVLSDLDLQLRGIECIPLVHDWPGWWSKMEAFRPGLFDDVVLLCDLDTMIGGSIDRLAEPGLAAMEDLLLSGRVSTALLRWTGDELAFLYRRFDADAARWMQPGSCGSVPNSVHGDQVVVDHLLREEDRMPAFIQTLYPETIDFFDAGRGAVGPITIFVGEVKPHLSPDGELVPPLLKD